MGRVDKGGRSRWGFRASRRGPPKVWGRKPKLPPEHGWARRCKRNGGLPVPGPTPGPASAGSQRGLSSQPRKEKKGEILRVVIC